MLPLPPNRNVTTLFICQALFWCAVFVGITLSSIVGKLLADSPDLATLPVALITLGSIIFTVPLSVIMQRYGRRVGFMLGALAGIIGGLISAIAIYHQSFVWFCIGNGCLGIFQASAFYYRLAAMDSVNVDMRGHAIAWVMSGGIVAAIVAPSLAIWSRDLFIPFVYSGSYLLVALIGLTSFLFTAIVLEREGRQIKSVTVGRPLLKILKQPIFITAMSNVAIGYCVMVLVMISTPLAIIGYGFSESVAAQVIQWHILGMFLPSFFSGKLVDRWGAPKVSLLGVVIMMVSSIIAITGITFINFCASLFMLGLGWNFMYVSGSTLIVASHTGEEQGKVQGAAELLTNSVIACAAFSSGVLLNQYGWTTVNTAVLPLLTLAGLITLLFSCLSAKRTQDRSILE